LDLSVIIPVFNEKNNISELALSIREKLFSERITAEIIISDGGSNDGTVEICKTLSRQNRSIIFINPRLRTDLITSVKKGFEVACGDYIAVMDGDGQHKPDDLVKLYKFLRYKNAHIVVGSRKLSDAVETLGDKRVTLSKIGNKLLKLLTSCELTDPLSGMFVIKASKLSHQVFIHDALGFKVLFHILSNTKGLRVVEKQIRFGARNFGESKLSLKVIYDFILQIISTILPIYISPRFISFCLIGAIGAVLHFSTFFLTLNHFESFIVANSLAMVIASAFNFLINNSLTFHSNSLSGKSLLKGFLTYFLICIFTIPSTTLFFNELVNKGMWPVFATLLGAIIDSAFKFIVAKRIVWKI